MERAVRLRLAAMLLAAAAVASCDRPSAQSAPPSDGEPPSAGVVPGAPAGNERPRATNAPEAGYSGSVDGSGGATDGVPEGGVPVVIDEGPAEESAEDEPTREDAHSTDANGVFVWPADGIVREGEVLPAVLELEAPFVARRVAAMWTAAGESRPEVGVGDVRVPMEVTFREERAHVGRVVLPVPASRVSLRGLGEVESLRVEFMRDAAGAPGEE